MQREGGMTQPAARLVVSYSTSPAYPTTSESHTECNMEGAARNKLNPLASAVLYSSITNNYNNEPTLFPSNSSPKTRV